MVGFSSLDVKIYVLIRSVEILNLFVLLPLGPVYLLVNRGILRRLGSLVQCRRRDRWGIEGLLSCRVENRIGSCVDWLKAKLTC